MTADSMKNADSNGTPAAGEATAALSARLADTEARPEGCRGPVRRGRRAAGSLRRHQCPPRAKRAADAAGAARRPNRKLGIRSRPGPPGLVGRDVSPARLRSRQRRAGLPGADDALPPRRCRMHDAVVRQALTDGCRLSSMFVFCARTTAAPAWSAGGTSAGRRARRRRPGHAPARHGHGHHRAQAGREKKTPAWPPLSRRRTMP